MGLTTCPARETLAAFAAGNLSGAPLEAVARHVDACADCRALVQAVTPRTDPLLAALRRDDPADPLLGGPGWARAVARFREVPPPAEAAPSTWDQDVSPQGPAPSPAGAGAVPAAWP